MKQKYKIATPDYTRLKVGMDGYKVMLYTLLSYVNYEIDDKELVKAAKKWIKGNTDYDTTILLALPDSFFTSIGKFCYILYNGGELNDQLMTTLHASAAVLNEKARIYKTDCENKDDGSVVADKDIKKVANIQDYMREKAREVAGEIELWVDEFMDDQKNHPIDKRDIAGLFAANSLKSGHLRYIVSFYEHMIPELDLVLNGEDDDIKEAYSFISKANIKKLREFYAKIIEVAGLMKSSGIKKPRTKRPIDKNKRVSAVNYLQKDEKLGLQSVHPVHILGAKSVWYFNTKTRKLGVYYAADGSGLDVKGTSIKNYSGNSTEKTVRASAKVDLRKFTSGKLLAKKELYDGIRSVAILGKGRFNEHTLILSVDK